APDWGPAWQATRPAGRSVSDRPSRALSRLRLASAVRSGPAPQSAESRRRPSAPPARRGRRAARSRAVRPAPSAGVGRLASPMREAPSSARPQRTARLPAVALASVAQEHLDGLGTEAARLEDAGETATGGGVRSRVALP